MFLILLSQLPKEFWHPIAPLDVHLLCPLLGTPSQCLTNPVLFCSHHCICTILFFFKLVYSNTINRCEQFSLIFYFYNSHCNKAARSKQRKYKGKESEIILSLTSMQKVRWQVKISIQNKTSHKIRWSISMKTSSVTQVIVFVFFPYVICMWI